MVELILQFRFFVIFASRSSGRGLDITYFFHILVSLGTSVYILF